MRKSTNMCLGVQSVPTCILDAHKYVHVYLRCAQERTVCYRSHEYVHVSLDAQEYMYAHMFFDSQK